MKKSRKLDRNQLAMERLRKIGEQYPELTPLLTTCKTVEEIEQAIQELQSLGW